MSTSSGRETSQTLDRGLRLLTLVADAPAGITMTEAASRLQVGRAVVYRLTATLIEHGMLRRDAEGRLRLGMAVLELAQRAQPLISGAALPPLRRLAEKAGATTHLTIADSGEALALLVVEPSWTQFHVAYRTGSRHPLDQGAAGRAIIAGRSGQAGYITSEGELQAGAHGVAAPILGVPGLEASVGVVVLGGLNAAEVGPWVVEAAQQVGDNLG
ncbi:MAG TPA: helix-turn-helix domain-containing protein [Micromonosporaceae bacterium]|nr:helix-turn-helix domain-containing protein [Micromonosporaceae bacterium]